MSKHSKACRTMNSTIRNQSKSSSSKTGSDWEVTHIDRTTTDAPNLEAEFQRLKNLKSFPVLSGETNGNYQRFAERAAQLLNAPVGLVSLVDLGRVSTVASWGPGEWLDGLRQVERKTSFCGHTILNKKKLLVISDTLKDSRFHLCSQVRDPPYTRFYAGAALMSSEGHALGTVSVRDTFARKEPLTGEQVEELYRMAQEIVDQMELERAGALEEEASPTTSSSTGLASAVKKSIAMIPHILGTVKPQESGECLNEAIAMPPPSLQREQSRESKAESRDSNENGGTVVTATGPIAIDFRRFINSLHFVMEAFPTRVAVLFSVDQSIPKKLVIDELKVFRSAVALMASACERTEIGYVRLNVYVIETGGKESVVFECEDTAPDVVVESMEDVFKPPTEPFVDESEDCFALDKVTGQLVTARVCIDPLLKPSMKQRLGIHVVVEYMDSIGGKYGCRRRSSRYDRLTGSVIWFSFPLQRAKDM